VWIWACACGLCVGGEEGDGCVDIHRTIFYQKNVYDKISLRPLYYLCIELCTVLSDTDPDQAKPRSPHTSLSSVSTPGAIETVGRCYRARRETAVGVAEPRPFFSVFVLLRSMGLFVVFFNSP
jgi:hypothetical protein